MRVLKIIWFYIKWIAYARATLNERHMYQMGKLQGMKCISMKDSINYTDYTYDPNLKPKRTCLSFEEFKWIHYPNKKGEIK